MNFFSFSRETVTPTSAAATESLCPQNDEVEHPRESTAAAHPADLSVRGGRREEPSNRASLSSLSASEYELEALQEHEKRQSRCYSEWCNALSTEIKSFRGTDTRTSTLPESANTHMRVLPLELWELIIEFVADGTDDDSFQSLGDLRNCALTCRVGLILESGDIL